jgi:predicted transposase YdaD
MRPVTKDLVMHLLSQRYAPRLLSLIDIEHHGVLRATKLPAEIVDPDCIWDLGDCLVNLEMETNMGPDMPWRLMDYRARLRRLDEFRDRPLYQHVLVLNAGSPPGQPRSTTPTGRVTVSDGEASLNYHVHLFRNFNPEPLLADPVTAVFAPLARATAQQRPDLLRRAVRAIAASDEPERERRTLLECVAVLAALRISDPTIITTTIKEGDMPVDISESSIVKLYVREAEARGIAVGEARGRAEGRLRGMLELRFGQAGAQVSDQTLEQLSLRPDPGQLIAEAETLDDLVHQLDT